MTDLGARAGGAGVPAGGAGVPAGGAGVPARAQHPEADRELVTRFLEHGDEQAFRSLYRRHAPALYRVAWRMLGGRAAEAEDVVQETWLRAVRGLDRFRWDSSLGTWLMGIAIRCAREALRRRAPRHQASDPAVETDGPPSSEPIGGLAIDLDRAIARLPAGYREVLILHDIEGYGHAEIAELLAIEVGTSKSQLHRARGAMRELLAAAAPPVSEVQP